MRFQQLGLPREQIRQERIQLGLLRLLLPPREHPLGLRRELPGKYILEEKTDWKTSAGVASATGSAAGDSAATSEGAG